MIVITKGATKVFDVTLTEKSTLSAPYYLFRFVHDLTTKEYPFILPDSSTFTARFSRFTFIEGTTGTLPTGFYHYYIYKQESNSNLDYTLSTTELEKGKLKVVSTTDTEPTSEFEADEEYKMFE